MTELSIHICNQLRTWRLYGILVILSKNATKIVRVRTTPYKDTLYSSLSKSKNESLILNIVYYDGNVYLLKSNQKPVIGKEYLYMISDETPCIFVSNKEKIKKVIVHESSHNNSSLKELHIDWHTGMPIGTSKSNLRSKKLLLDYLCIYEEPELEADKHNEMVVFIEINKRIRIGNKFIKCSEMNELKTDTDINPPKPVKLFDEDTDSDMPTLDPILNNEGSEFKLSIEYVD